MSIIIRPMREDDPVSAITNVMHRSFADLARQGFNYVAAHQSDEETASDIANGRCFVAVADQRIVGAMVYEPPHSRTHDCAWYDQHNVGTLHRLGVLPEFQKHGVGRQLVGRAEQEACRDGAEGLALDTAESAIQLVNWYERMGYQPVDTIQWPGKNFRCTILNKALTSPI